MAVASTLILVYGESPARVYFTMLSHSLGDLYGFGQVIARATPLVFTGLAVAMALHAGLFNIGGEGQLALGSLAAALVGTALPVGTPMLLGALACTIAGALAGGAAGAIPGLLKARLGAHEVITTIMLNFMIQALILWSGRRLFFMPDTIHTRPVVAGARLPSLHMAGSSASAALGIAFLMAGACWFFLFRTRHGFEHRALGKNPLAAEAAGISLPRTIFLSMTISGALAGLVGTSTVLGYKGYFEDGLGSGTGFMGIAVALLARNHPLGVIPAAFFLGLLSHGGLAANALVPKELVEIMQGAMILAMAVTSAVLARAPVSKEPSWTT
ncbi:MAG: ABC transporter permease [Deltaproteobacteria bacterium]|nr:ABC transporter permease [Deltaproteobacteria bacterium]